MIETNYRNDKRHEKYLQRPLTMNKGFNRILEDSQNLRNAIGE